jgi:two-component system response regulator YesN
VNVLDEVNVLQGARGTYDDRRVARVVRYVVANLSRRVTLQDAAAVAGLEPLYFSKLFRKTVARRFTAWSGWIRVEHSKELLCIADLSITAIAAAVGYSDVTTFARTFRRCEGVCPREYRRRVVRNIDAREKTENAGRPTGNAETINKPQGQN